MSDLVLVLGQNLALVLACMGALWLLSLWMKDASIVDVFWGICCVFVAWASYARTGSDRALLLAGLTTLWGARLSIYLGFRSVNRPEDPRYQRLRERYAPFWWKSFFVVFLLQGGLLFLVSLPLQLGALDRRALAEADAVASAAAFVGALLFGIGFSIEVAADRQLRKFKADPAHRGQVLQRGLWAWSRHPNYFGEMLLWWGLFLIALPAPLAWASVLGPATLTFLLLRVSGVPMLEEQMKQRGPAYVEYMRRTSTFFPRPPRP